ncbi:MAG: sulfatase [Thermoanaerobaculia bacterium]|nr:sulfatase [Thermoanaerobaculia bacterium]
MSVPPRPAALARCLATALALTANGASVGAQPPRYPDVLVITVDTLRPDRLGAWGHARPTSPAIDALLGEGLRFAEARTVEPLTTPALASLWTSVPPHVHGSTRNGLPIRSGLASLPRLLGRRGFRTAAVLGNWTLKDQLSGLAGEWQHYELLTSRKRWFGLFKDEARGRDLTDSVLAWLADSRTESATRPLLLWVHYVEPHAPYRLQADFAPRLGISPERATDLDRYDSEIAAVDAEVARLLAGWRERSPERPLLTVFLADHGEAFGEHGEHGHGRLVHEPTLRIPLGFHWPGRIPAGVAHDAVSTLDVAPTLLGLLGLPAHPSFAGRDLAPRFAGEPVAERPICVQAHKGAVQSVQAAARARRAGLIEAGVVAAGQLEALALGRGERRLYDLQADPDERRSLVDPKSPASESLTACLDAIRAGLTAADQVPPPALDPDSIAELRALGYLD